MMHDSYAEVIENDDDFGRFYFVSTGKKGEIKKIIAFTPSTVDELYQLGFGDVIGDDVDDVDDKVVSDNGDRDKVLATVVGGFISIHREISYRWVLFRGSTNSRTRLYRMAITLHHEELSSLFDIYGLLAGDEVIPFPKGTFYRFPIQEKMSIFTR